MKSYFMIPALAAAMLVPVVAHAERAYTTSNLSMRAGPGRDYPRIARLPSNVRVNLLGCLNRYDWCDVTYRGARGWVNGDALAIRYDDRRVRVFEYGPHIRLPIITFSFDSYWDNHYNRRPFYNDRDVWRDRWRGWGGGRDQDRDGVPNRADRDQDGDGIRNSRDSDRDGDGIRNDRDRDRDGDGVRNNRDRNPNRPRN